MKMRRRPRPFCLEPYALGWTAGVARNGRSHPTGAWKSEVLYMRFENDSPTFTGTTINGINFGVPGRAYEFATQQDAVITRVGVNYRFGGGPILAKY
jgi:hypothetical protein